MLSASITVFAREPQFSISPFLHGQFIEHLGEVIYPGIWDGEALRSETVEALREIAPPVVRWPGGCFADAYNWRDGIGPRNKRPKTVTSRWGVDEIEPNTFGTHEFMDFCRQIGAEPWLGGNVGSGTPRELAEWVEYCNYGAGTTLAETRAANGSAEPFNVKFWGIGNESWDCGGKFTPETYADAYRQFESIFPRFAGQEPFLIGCGPDGAVNSTSASWTRRALARLDEWRQPRLHGWDTHFYTWNSKGEFGSTRDFSLDEYYGLLSESLKVGTLIDEQRAILDASQVGKDAKLILGEWGIWHPADPEENDGRLLWQQNTLRDAISAAMTLDLFHQKGDKLWMATLAQTVNCLQSLVLTWGEGVVKTPTYHVFSMYRGHRDGQFVHSEWDSGEAAGLPRLSGSASVQNNILTLSVVNAGARSAVEAQISLPSIKIEDVAALELSHASLASCNTPDAPDVVAPREIEVPFELGKSDFVYTFSPASVTVFLVKLAP